MKRLPILIMLFALACSLFGFGSNATAADNTTTAALIGMIPIRGPVALHSAMAPLIRTIDGAVARAVRLEVSPTYERFFRDAKAERFEFLIPPAQHVEQLITQYGYRELIRSRTTTRSIVIARADAGISTLANLRDRTVLFPSTLSIVALEGRRMLADEGLVDGNNIAIRYVESEDHVLMSVLDGDAPAGVCSDITHRSLQQSLRNLLPVIAVGKEAPMIVILAGRSVPQAEVESIREALLAETANVNPSESDDPAAFSWMVVSDQPEADPRPAVSSLPKRE